MNSKNSKTVGNIHVLYPKKRTQELEMEDPDLKKRLNDYCYKQRVSKRLF